MNRVVISIQCNALCCNLHDEMGLGIPKPPKRQRKSIQVTFDIIGWIS